MYCFFDISKAFDFLNHKNLLGKLESLGLSSRSLRWFRSYLADRRQRVLINGELSDCRSITHGVSQGSILDPLLSNTYVNSLPNAVKNARVILCMLMTPYAVLICTASTSVELQAILAREFNWICDWYNENKLAINMKMTKLMLACRE